MTFYSYDYTPLATDEAYLYKQYKSPMPLITKPNYKPPFLFKNGHVQSIFPVFFRKITPLTYVRQRIETPDDDFIDLDWSCVGAQQVAVVAHGLEGHSRRAYMQGMIRTLNRRGWDGVAFNFRGCSGQPNRLVRSYHSGATEDLHHVIRHVIAKKRYSAIALVGFSIGGNLTLKYLGEAIQRSSLIKCAAAISVPCDLEACAHKLSAASNTLYLKRFLRMFHKKIRQKMKIIPGKITDKNFKSIRSLKAFDDRYTAPIHGFLSAQDYYSKCSCNAFLPKIKIPTLIISAQNDPFLPPQCYPMKAAENSPCLFLEMPVSGGHVGFIEFNPAGEYWHEKQVASFFARQISSFP